MLSLRCDYLVTPYFLVCPRVFFFCLISKSLAQSIRGAWPDCVHLLHSFVKKIVKFFVERLKSQGFLLIRLGIELGIILKNPLVAFIGQMSTRCAHARVYNNRRR
jgi:hypothetical protein